MAARSSRGSRTVSSQVVTGSAEIQNTIQIHAPAVISQPNIIPRLR